MMAGHGGDAVTWLSPDGRPVDHVAGFAASPVPAVKAFIDAHPIDADYGKTWTRLLPPSRYRQPDDADGEAPPSGWTRSFPHVLSGRGEVRTRRFTASGSESPFANAYLGAARRVARRSAAARQNARRPTCSRSASPAPTSSAMRSVPTARKYRTSTRTWIARSAGSSTVSTQFVGPRQYVVALTADHGVTAIPEQMDQAGQGRRAAEPRRHSPRSSTPGSRARSARAATSRA